MSKKDLDDRRLKSASDRDDTERIITLIKQGADVHFSRDYPLRHACGKGNLNLIKFLIKEGADVHAWNDCSLEWAKAANHLHVVKYLEGVMLKEKRLKELANIT